MQNCGSIAWKLAKLWPFEYYILYVRDVRTDVTTESSSKSDDVDLANIFAGLSWNMWIIRLWLLLLGTGWKDQLPETRRLNTKPRATAASATSVVSPAGTTLTSRMMFPNLPADPVSVLLRPTQSQLNCVASVFLSGVLVRLTTALASPKGLM